MSNDVADIEWLYYENPDGERYALHDGIDRCVLGWSLSGMQYNWRSQSTAMGLGDKLGGYSIRRRILRIAGWVNGCRPCDKLGAIGHIHDIIAPDKPNGCDPFEGKLWLSIKGERYYYTAVPSVLPGYDWSLDDDPSCLEDTLAFQVTSRNLYSDSDEGKLICFPLETEQIVDGDSGLQGTNGIAKFDGCEWDDLRAITIPGDAEKWHVIYESRSGKVYAGGHWFVANTSDQGLYCYDPSTDSWSQVCATFQNSHIYDIVETPDGKIWFTGQFDDAGGVTADSIACYDPATGTCNTLNGGGLTLNGNSGFGYTLEVWNQFLLIGGNFLQAGPNCQQNYAVYDWIAGNWVQVDIFFDGEVNDILQTTQGTIIGGDFTQVTNVQLNPPSCAGGDYSAPSTMNVGHLVLNTDAFFSGLTDMNGGVTGEVEVIEDCNGSVLIGGHFPGHATQYSSGGYTPYAGIQNPIVTASCGANGVLYLSDGGTTPINTTPNGNFNIYCYQGGAFYPIKIQVNNANQLCDIHVGQMSGCIYFSGTTFLRFRTSACNKIDVPCDECVSPCFTFKGPGKLLSIQQGNDAIYFSDSGYTSISNGINLLNGETVKLDLTGSLHPDGNGRLTTAPTLVSDLRGNITSYIMPGSNTAGFTLDPGPNDLVVHAEAFVDDGGNVLTVEAEMCFQCRYKAFPHDDVEELPICD